MIEVFIWEIGRWHSLQEAQAGVIVRIKPRSCHVFVLEEGGRRFSWDLFFQQPPAVSRQKTASSIYARPEMGTHKNS